MNLTETEILTGIKDYFGVYELVDKQTFNKYGEKCWQFIDIRLLHTLLVIRDELDKPITINDWKWRENGFQQRGLRTNICSIVKKKTLNGSLYLSAHTMGKAIDFDVKGMKADEVREWLIENEDLLPYKIRLEHKINKTGKTITWVHMDVYYLERNKKLTLFNV